MTGPNGAVTFAIPPYANGAAMTSVKEHIRRMLPLGTRPAAAYFYEIDEFPRPGGDDHGAGLTWEEIPYCPTDSFAVTASLLNSSGAYHHIRSYRPESSPASNPQTNTNITHRSNDDDFS